jgi:S-DNA-T family DNA segregation ATPase FtsK/SpoIIIE
MKEKMMEYNYPIEILNSDSHGGTFSDELYVRELADRLTSCMNSFKIHAEIVSCHTTPLTAVFELKLQSGTSVKQIKNRRADIELALACPLEMMMNVAGKTTIRIAAKTLHRPIFGLRGLLEDERFLKAKSKLTAAVGIDLTGDRLYIDVAETPHMLIAGTTGSGKSVFIDNILMSILYRASPEDVRFLMIDPKKVELGPYNGIPHLIGNVVYDTETAFASVLAIEDEMMHRFEKFTTVGARDIDTYISSSGEKIPHIVIVIDEYMEMMMEAPKDFEESIARITRLGRAAGVHIIIATQRATSKIITSRIKANIPCRASFTMVDGRESKTILDRTGAERLLGNGDMIYSIGDDMIPIHAQTAYISDKEVFGIINYLKEKQI